MIKSKRFGGGKWPVILVCFALVTGLGVIGPAMAQWGVSLHIFEDVELGHISIGFSRIDNDWYDSGLASVEATDYGDLENGKLVIESQSLPLNESTGNWTGEVVWDFKYTITNNGTVPVILEDLNTVERNDSCGGIIFDPDSTNSLDEEIDPGQSTSGVMKITFWGPIEAGVNRWEFELPYHQWNLKDPFAGWHDELQVEVIIYVEENS